MKKMNAIAVLGLAGTLLGWVATLVGNYASDKKQEETIKKEVQKAMMNFQKDNGAQ